jgi:hypothetical protein
MDDTKCTALKAELAAQPEPQVVSIERFFDGNDDLGSIGCNLLEHPGLEVFREVLEGLQRRPDVEAVYARISELDPGDGCWPFTDTLFIVGTIPPEELRRALSPLEPDEVDDGDSYGIPPTILQQHRAPVLAAWWD